MVRSSSERRQDLSQDLLGEWDLDRERVSGSEEEELANKSPSQQCPKLAR